MSPESFIISFSFLTSKHHRRIHVCPPGEVPFGSSHYRPASRQQFGIVVLQSSPTFSLQPDAQTAGQSASFRSGSLVIGWLHVDVAQT